MTINFEKISKFADLNINLPQRKTTGSAGYDFEIAEDIIVPSWMKLFNKLIVSNIGQNLIDTEQTLELAEIAEITKSLKTKPTLVPTGIKCKLDPGTYLELTVRSSCPLKHQLIMANGVGIIDTDYYNNSDNEGHIFFQLINLSPFDIQLRKGDIIGQGIIKPYLTVENDNATGIRAGGFGSTSNG